MAKNTSPNPIPDNEAWRIFFDVYRNLPELWDENCTFYKSKQRRKKAYAKLLYIYKMICKGATHDALTKRLLNIKRCYRREVKKVLKFENVGEKYVPTLWYYSLLKSFLDPETSKDNTQIDSDLEPSVAVECCLKEIDEDETTENVAETDEDGASETGEATLEHPPPPEDLIYEESRKRLRSYLDQVVKRNAQIVEGGNVHKKLKPSDQNCSLQSQPPYMILRNIGPPKDQNLSTKKQAQSVTNQEFIVNPSNGMCTRTSSQPQIILRQVLAPENQKGSSKEQEFSTIKQEFPMNPSNSISTIPIPTQPQFILRQILPTTSQAPQIKVQEPTINFQEYSNPFNQNCTLTTQPYLILRNASLNNNQEPQIKGQEPTISVQESSSLNPSSENCTLTTQPYMIFKNVPPNKDQEQPVKVEEQPVKDEASAYAESWAMSFRQLSPMQKIYAKKAIEDILVLGQLECLSLNTVDTISASGNAPDP